MYFHYLNSRDLAQCINYLKASGLGIALLIKFQRPKVEWKRALLNSQLSPAAII